MTDANAESTRAASASWPGEREYVVTDRVAVVMAALLAQPAGLTVREVMALTGLTVRGAYYLMERLCRTQVVVFEPGSDALTGRRSMGRWRHLHAPVTTQR